MFTTTLCEIKFKRKKYKQMNMNKNKHICLQKYTNKIRIKQYSYKLKRKLIRNK